MATTINTDYNFKDWVSCNIKKARQSDNVGLTFEKNPRLGHYFVTQVGGLAKMFSDVKVGDRLLKFQGKNASDYCATVRDLDIIFKTGHVYPFGNVTSSI